MCFFPAQIGWSQKSRSWVEVSNKKMGDTPDHFTIEIPKPNPKKKKHKHQFYPPIPKSICGKKPIHLLGKSSRLAPFPGYPQPPTRPEKPTIPPSNRPIDRLAHLQGGTGAIDMSIREDLPTTLATRPDLEERATKICREKIRGEILPMDMFPEKLT